MPRTSTGRGRLKVFLGYAAGVGKTYQMLVEARALAAAGVDVVIGYFEPHGRADTIALTGGLEAVPRRPITYRGSEFEEMDVDALLRRRPAVAVVDEFAHTNVPGSLRAKRWEDVHALLESGVDVLTTVNIQHVESLNDQIWQSTGVRVRETIPDWVLEQADETVMVDLTPQALLNRLARGVVYPPEQARAAQDNFFRKPTLVALRELAMRQAAHSVEHRWPPQAVPSASPGPGPTNVADTQDERILLVVGPSPATAALIRRGRRLADQLRADCLAVYVSSTPDLAHLTPRERDRLDQHLNFARALRIEARVIEGTDTAAAVVGFARRHAVTQILLDRGTHRGRTWGFWSRSELESIVGLAAGLQVTIVADRSVRPAAGGPPRLR